MWRVSEGGREKTRRRRGRERDGGKDGERERSGGVPSLFSPGRKMGASAKKAGNECSGKWKVECKRKWK